MKIMKIVAAILANDERYSERTSHPFPEKVYPGLRLIYVLLCAVLIGVSKNLLFVTGLFAVLIFRLSMWKPEEIQAVLRKILLPVALTILLMLPSLFFKAGRSFVTVVVKVLTELLLFAEMNERMAWKDVTQALTVFHFPETLTLLLDMTVNFLVILGRTCEEIREAAQLRGGGQWRGPWRKNPAGGILGTTYLISDRTARETSEAMVLRGYTGKYRTVKKYTLHAADIVYGILMAGTCAGFWLIETRVKGI